MPDYTCNGEAVILEDHLGDGAEGVVKRGRQISGVFAYKIWNPSSRALLQFRQRKVRAALGVDFRSDIYAPNGALLDAAKDVMGFRMNLMPPDIVKLWTLDNVLTWVDNRLSQRDVLTVNLNLLDLLEWMWDRNIHFGDLNPNNVGMNPKTLKVAGWDGEAYWYGPSLPCITMMPDFMSPRLYGKDLATPGVECTQKDDLIAYIINAIRSMLRAHPYRQGKTKEPDVHQRVLKKLHILNRNLEYPNLQVAFPLTSLTDELLAVFYTALESVPTLDNLPDVGTIRQAMQNMLASLVECKKHAMPTVYPSERRACPHCMKDLTVPDFSTITVASSPFRMVPVYSLKAQKQMRRLLFAKAVTRVGETEQVLFMLSYDRNYRLIASWIKNQNDVREVVLPESFVTGQQYDANAYYIIISLHGKTKMFTYAGQQVYDFETSTFSQKDLVSMGERYPIWMLGSHIRRGSSFKTTAGQSFTSEDMLNMTAGNVWMTAGYNPKASRYKDVIVGYLSWFGQNSWFCYRDGLELPLVGIAADPGEMVLDAQVVFDGRRFAIVRQTQPGLQSPRVRIEIFDEGQLLHSDILGLESVQGRVALSEGKTGVSLMIPTEDGVLQCKVGQKPSILLGTENIPRTSSLVAVNGALWVINDDAEVSIVARK